jgi:lysophospholipase L1-like esterase
MPTRRRGSTRRRRAQTIASMPKKEWRSAIRQGKEQAQAVLEERRRRARRRRAVRLQALASPGLLVAEGDSWFDYPFFDVLEELEEGYNYEVESVAHRGDTAEEMAYDPNQLAGLARKLERLKRDGRTPRAVLLSGGGNDIAGVEFAVLLNHKLSGLPPVNVPILTGLVDERLRTAIVSLASAVTELCRRSFGSAVPILIHGYDYPVPDGRGYLGGFWILPGPWLEPGFRQKGYQDLGERVDVMVTLIDRFNALLASVAGGPGLEHVAYVNLRGILSNELRGKKYKTWWNDELHPTEKGFTEIADRFDQTLRRLPQRP